MDAPWVAIAINVVVVLGGLWVASIRMTLKISTIKSSIERAIASIEAETASKIKEHYQSSLDAIDGLRREIGETITAIRQKINDDTLYAAKEYMRRDGFLSVKQEIEVAMREIREGIEKRLERMETKLDSKT